MYAPMIEITRQPFGKLADGREASLFTLKAANGIRLALTDYGAAIVQLHTPDRRGKLQDITLGYDDVRGYEQGSSYFGCTVGRYGNRIAGGHLPVNEHTHQLACNDGPHHLHGGLVGFGRHLWDAEETEGGVCFTRVSPHGEDGYPGTLTARVWITLNAVGELSLRYQAVTDAWTHVNLTNHAYFNLAGHAAGTVLDHKLCLSARSYIPIDAGFIPLGHIADVEDTALDFRNPSRIGDRIDSTTDEQIVRGRGYDHCFVIDGRPGILRLAASVLEPISGRLMEVLTTEPSMQFYSGNFLNGTQQGKGGVKYAYRSGLCLETQHFPDSPNQPAFPSTLLSPEERYESETIYRFTTVP
ncbi:MAG: galactose mutarotase [Verrucomicrobiaceae bacterium]|nr:galactose mutarotase [Verrucomicrobiaceae bacterium]